MGERRKMDWDLNNIWNFVDWDLVVELLKIPISRITELRDSDVA